MSETLDLTASYEAIHHGVVRFSLKRDLVRIGGPDALSYLEGQCSQHVADLKSGESVETLLLSPQGKVESYGHVALDQDAVAVLVVEEGFGEAAFDRLRRFKLRVKVELELRQVETVAVWGPKGLSAADGADAAVVVAIDWPGCAGRELIGLSDGALDAIAQGDPAALEIVRIEAGIPALGRELTEKTIPQETGIVDRTVSFSKGCYTGQELVARIDARGGNVPRHLRGIVFAEGAVSDDALINAPMLQGERQLGTVTSYAWSPRLSRLVGLGYVRRDCEPPADAVLVTENGETSLRIESLPLYRP